MKLPGIHNVADDPINSTRRPILAGPTLVLAEAEQRSCAISAVWISRRTDPLVIRDLQRSLDKHIPVVEVSAAELAGIAGGRSHGGVVADLQGRHRRGHWESGLGWWGMASLSVPEFARSRAFFDHV